MTPKTLKNEIERLKNELFDFELAIDYVPSVINNTTKTKAVTWANCKPNAKLAFATLSEYKWLMKERQYTFVLFDGALIQLSYTFERKALIKHRLAFYPYPLDLSKEDRKMYQEEGFSFVDILEFLTFEQFQHHLRLQSPLRFDFDLQQAKESHSASHLHLQQNECRIPVFAPLSIGHFIQFIFQHFYPLEWESYPFLNNWPINWFDRTLATSEENQLHLNSLRK